jgi:hypothetical protein
MTWTTRVLAVDVVTGERKSITHVDEATMGLVLQLATCRADFVWDGKRAIGNPPIVDPVKRELLYSVELFPL